MSDQTNNLRLNLPEFNKVTWHDEVNGNFEILDAVLGAMGVYTNLKGIWQNATSYSLEDKVVDATVNSFWRCTTAHVSPATGSFIADRAANPNRWSAISSGFVPRGAWTNDTLYAPNDISYDGSAGLICVCLVQHTSSSSPDKLRDDLNDGKWLPMADIGPAIAIIGGYAASAGASAASAAAAKTAAETAETNAETAETNAETAETNAAASASAASGSATTASGAATTATTQAGIATAQAGTATTQAGIATTQANNAATLYDLFDDRMLGSKAANPTLDNDGNALVVGTMYWNSTVGELRFWNGTIWVGYNLSLYLPLGGGTMTGALITTASVSGASGFRIPHGTAPSSPTNGDVWTTSAALFYRINGVTFQSATLAGTEILSNKSVVDGSFFIVGSSDATKRVRFEVDGNTTATDRVVTLRNLDGTLAYTSDFIGRKTQFIRADEFTPFLSSGASAGVRAIATSSIPLLTLNFDTAVSEYAVVPWAPPKSWDGGTISAEVLWTSTGGGSGGVVFRVAATAFGDNDLLTTAFSGGINIAADTYLGTDRVHRTAESAAVTVQNSPASMDMIYLMLNRNVADAGDTLAQDAQVIGVRLFYNTNAGTDI